MNLLLFLLLQSSLIHHSLQAELKPDELYAELKGGFPPGSLMTIYLKYEPHDYKVKDGWEKSIAVNLYADFSSPKGSHLHFRLDATGTSPVVSNVGQPGYSKVTQESYATYGAPSEEKLWRFDLYKLSDTTFIPFFNGFNAKLRTMLGVPVISSVHFRSHKDNLNPPNFDMNDVYMSRRLPNVYKPTPETVLAALNQNEVAKNSKTSFLTLEKGFPVGGKIKLSALMLSRPAVKDEIASTANNAAIYFLSNDKYWFGICNSWDKISSKVKLYLFADRSDANPSWREKNDGTRKDCTLATTSTDIVHVKMERPNETTIKMRIYYLNGTAGGIKCEIGVGAEGAKQLNNPLTVQGAMSGTLLHFYKSF